MSKETPKNKSAIREIIDFSIAHKKWWLLPIVITLSVIALLTFLGQSTVISPFVYTFI